MGDEDDGLPNVFLDVEKLVLKTVAGDRVNRPERLVHEHDRGVGGHRPRHPDPLLLTAGKLDGIPVAVLSGIEADEFEERVGAVGDALLLPVQKPGNGPDVLGDCAVGEKPDLLDGVPDLPSEFGSAHGGVRFAVNEDFAIRRLDEPIDHTHARGFAAPGRANENTNLPFGNLEGEVVYHRRVGAFISLRDFSKLDHCISYMPRENNPYVEPHRFL